MKKTFCVREPKSLSANSRGTLRDGRVEDGQATRIREAEGRDREVTSKQNSPAAALTGGIKIDSLVEQRDASIS